MCPFVGTLSQNSLCRHPFTSLWPESSHMFTPETITKQREWSHHNERRVTDIHTALNSHLPEPLLKHGITTVSKHSCGLREGRKRDMGRQSTHHHTQVSEQVRGRSALESWPPDSQFNSPLLT